ncbi:MAG: endolytic transglycosylase MltG [Bdellovibrionales bacterium]|nr:endolytic transglycosylase MltG [Bdellovibrionales bacterium]
MFNLIRYFLYIFIPLVVGLASYFYLHQIFFVPLSPGDTKTSLVEIPANMELSDICTLLAQKRVIRQKQSLCLFKKLRGDTKRIIPGEYKLSASYTPGELLKKLEGGEVYLRPFDVPVGATLWDIDEVLANVGLFDRHEFEAAATNADLLARAGVAASSFEGYLAPGSYSYTKGTKPESILWDMMEKGEKEYWSAEYTKALEELRMSRHEILTLASIIQKASGDAEERRLVSSVLHNRLKNGMKLRSEEALIYAIRDFEGTLKKSDLALPSPYNTFLNYGLPPGPILNPGRDAIEVALNPPETTYLFYGKAKAGQLVFATTLKEFKELTGEEDEES